MRMTPRHLCFALLCLLGCAAGPARLTAGLAPGQSARRACPRFVVGAEAAVRHSPVLVLSGGQGTVEAPRFLGDLACQLGGARPVVVALEWPRNAQGLLQRYLAGGANAEGKLRAHPLWTEAPAAERGLATQAMWELLVRLRELRATGVDVTVLPFGANAPTAPEEAEDGYGDRWERYQRSEKLDELERKHADAAVLLWIDPAEVKRAYELDAGPDLPEQHADRRELVAYVGSLGLRALRFQVEVPPPAAQPTSTASAAAAVSTPPPWALERRAELSGFDGVARLGVPTVAPRLPR